jgi:hypothetical protein
MPWRRYGEEFLTGNMACACQQLLLLKKHPGSMNRIDRVTAILIQLQSKKVV